MVHIVQLYSITCTHANKAAKFDRTLQGQNINKYWEFWWRCSVSTGHMEPEGAALLNLFCDHCLNGCDLSGLRSTGWWSVHFCLIREPPLLYYSHILHNAYLSGILFFFLDIDEHQNMCAFLHWLIDYWGLGARRHQRSFCCAFLQQPIDMSVRISEW